MTVCCVKDEEDKVVFTSPQDSPLQTELVAIALALSSLYGEPRAYYTYKDKVCTGMFDKNNAFAAMQSKLRKCIYNRKITRAMPLVVDTIGDFVRVKRQSKTLDGLSEIEKTERIMEKTLEFMQERRL